MTTRRLRFLAVALPFLCLVALAPLAYAEEVASARDISVDTHLVADASMSGVLPPTGTMSPALPAAGRSMLGQSAVIAKRLSLGGAATLTDRKGRVYQVEGDVRFATKGSDEWKKVEIGTVLTEGSIILTAKGASVSVTFDEIYANVVHIAENTRAVFRSIEPTDIFLEDGTLYNLVDGLEHQKEWKVTTPVAVAAVRGTWYLVHYVASTGEIISAVFDVPEDGQDSSVQLIEVLASGEMGTSVEIPEGNQMSLKEGQSPDPSLLKAIDPRWLEAIQDFLEDVALKRTQEDANQKGGDSSFFDSDSEDLFRTDRNGDLPDLDPQLDTGALAEDTSTTDSSEDSSQESGGERF